MPDINAPYPYFANPSKGVPLANGYIYIGLPDLDPTIPANQVTITAKQEDGTNVPLVQPIRTNAGGLPTYNGGVVQLQNLVTVVYSIQVLDASMVPIYYQAQAYGIPSLGSGGTPTALTLLDGTAAMPSLAFLNNLDTGLYYVAPNELHFSIDGQDTVSIRTDVTDSELRITSPDAAATTEYFGDGEASAFRTGVAGGFSLVMDDAARDLIIGTSATERLRITDLGSITSGGLATATVQPGGLDLQQSGTGFIQGWRSTAVSTGIPGTGAPDEMYGWVQPVDLVGGFNVSGASGNLVGLVMTGYAGVVSTGVQTAPVMVDARISGGGSIPVASNVFGVANNGTPIFAVLGDGSISPNPVDSIDDLLIGGAFATGGAALNATASPSGGVTIATANDGFPFVLQDSSIAHGMTGILPTDTYFVMGVAPIPGGTGFEAVGGTGEALTINATVNTANTGATSEGVFTMRAYKQDATLNIPLSANETAFSFQNGLTPIMTLLGDGTVTLPGQLAIQGGAEFLTALSDQIIHKGTTTVQPFTAISTDPDTFGIIRANVISNGGYRVLGFAASTTAAYRVDAYTAAPASGFGLDSPIRFTGYKSNGGTGSATIAATENVFSVWNQSANCLLNITGNGNQTIAGSVVTGGGTVPPAADLGSLSVFTGTADGIAQYWLNSDVVQPFTSLAPANAYLTAEKASSTTGGVRLRAFGSAQSAFLIEGNTATAKTTPFLGSSPAVTLRGHKTDGGTGTANFADGEIFFNIANGSNYVAAMSGAGNLFLAGSIATGGETAPDVNPGGICINSPNNSGFYATMKNPNVAHGMTTIAETDTFHSMQQLTAGAGGVLQAAYSENATALLMQGISTGANTATTARGTVSIQAAKASGTTAQSLAANENVLTIHNNSSDPVAVFKGNGDQYLDGGLAVGGGTNLLSNYTEFADLSIVLADAATGGNVATFTKVSARATRIGREVTVYLNLQDINTAGMTAGNTLFIRGMPYVAGITTFGGAGRYENITFATPPTFQASAGQSYVTLVISNSGGAASNITVAALTSGTADIRGSFSYIV